MKKLFTIGITLLISFTVFCQQYNTYFVIYGEHWFGEVIQKGEANTNETFTFYNSEITHSLNVGNMILTTYHYKITKKTVTNDKNTLFECTNKENKEVEIMIIPSKKNILFREDTELKKYYYK